MDFKRRDLLIEVKDLHFTHPHYMESAQTYLLRALLILPRPNVASREEVRILESTERGELIGKKAEFHEKALFKQTVEGPFAIGLQLSEAVAEDSFAAIIGEIVSSTVETAGSLLAARAIPILRSGIRTSAGFFAGRLKDKDPVIIAEDINQVAPGRQPHPDLEPDRSGDPEKTRPEKRHQSHEKAAGKGHLARGRGCGHGRDSIDLFQLTGKRPGARIRN